MDVEGRVMQEQLPKAQRAQQNPTKKEKQAINSLR
jgi:hypothetical protein